MAYIEGSGSINSIQYVLIFHESSCYLCWFFSCLVFGCCVTRCFNGNNLHNTNECVDCKLSFSVEQIESSLAWYQIHYHRELRSFT